MGLVQENGHAEAPHCYGTAREFAGWALAAETFYIVFDATLHGCTITTADPTDNANYKVLGTYKSEAEAKKAIADEGMLTFRRRANQEQGVEVNNLVTTYWHS